MANGTENPPKPDPQPEERVPGEFPLFHLLSDDPADVDTWEPKNHEKIAKAIYDRINNHKRAEGPLSIAILGDWGSGKSTVVKILKRGIEKGEWGDENEDPEKFKKETMQRPPRKDLFVVFDAWEHKGDGLRMAFLKNIVKLLRYRFWSWYSPKNRIWNLEHIGGRWIHTSFIT